MRPELLLLGSPETGVGLDFFFAWFFVLWFFVARLARDGCRVGVLIAWLARDRCRSGFVVAWLAPEGLRGIKVVFRVIVFSSGHLDWYLAIRCGTRWKTVCVSGVEMLCMGTGVVGCWYGGVLGYGFLEDWILVRTKVCKKLFCCLIALVGGYGRRKKVIKCNCTLLDSSQ